MKYKDCKVCNLSYSLLFRVKIDSSKEWYFLCKECTEENKRDNKYYSYGGTWKG